MMDASILVNPVNAGDWGMQQLPAPQAQDVKRFEDVLTHGELSVDSTQDVKDPILTVLDPSSETFGGFKQAFLEKVQVMDNSYHSVLSQMQDLPNLRQNLVTDRANNDVVQMRTYPEVASSTGATGQIESKAQNVADNILSAAEYQNHIYQWATKMEMWFSHMKIISSAVGQVSQGFKTLFQAS